MEIFKEVQKVRKKQNRSVVEIWCTFVRDKKTNIVVIFKDHVNHAFSFDGIKWE